MLWLTTSSPCLLLVLNPMTTWPILQTNELTLLSFWNSNLLPFFQLLHHRDRCAHIPKWLYDLILKLLFQSINIICNCSKFWLIQTISHSWSIKILLHSYRHCNLLACSSDISNIIVVYNLLAFPLSFGF